MPKISDKKREKIAEQILYHLYTISPEAIFTSKIAESIARDEEFTKTILQDLKNKKLIVEVNKNAKGMQYLRRQRWRLSNETYKVYTNHQNLDF